MIRFLVSAMVFLCSLSLGLAQGPTKAESAAALAAKEKLPLVIFVGQPGRSIPGAVVTRDDSHGKKPGIYVYADSAKAGLRFDTLTDAELRGIGKDVSRSASPFGQSSADAEFGVSVEALDEVNAARAARGLRPFVRDDGLTAAAKSAARFRAARRLAGHTPNDFAHLPPGANANAAGCAAWPPELGWGSCCCYENWTYAGAAWALGSDGQRYMHLYVR